MMEQDIFGDTSVIHREPPPLQPQFPTPASNGSNGNGNHPDRSTSTSGTISAPDVIVRAQAISSEDYYAEVRRRIREEEYEAARLRIRTQRGNQVVVHAVDVVPLPMVDSQDGNISTITPVTNGGAASATTAAVVTASSTTEMSGKEDASRTSYPWTGNFVPREGQRRWLWFGLFGGGIACLTILVLTVVLTTVLSNQSSVNSDDFQNNQSDDYDDDDLSPGTILVGKDEDNYSNYVIATMNSPVGKLVGSVLPKSSLESIKANFEGPQSKAFAYLVDNDQYLGLGLGDAGGKDNDAEEIYQKLTPFQQNKIKTVFSLVTLYHSLDGNKWHTRANWLDPTKDVCDWQGVNCKNELATQDYAAQNDKAGASTATTKDSLDVQKPDGVTGSKEKEGFDYRRELRWQANPQFLQVPPQRLRMLRSTDDSRDGAESSGSRTREIMTKERYLEDSVYAGIGDEESQNDFDDVLFMFDDAFLDEFDNYDKTDPDEYLEDTIPIRSLELNFNNLVGTLPDEVGLLSNVYELIDLGGNKISGSIPSTFKMLSRLEGLNLSDNILTSILPSDLGYMRFMRRFDVSGNPGIHGILPWSFKFWIKIDELSIHGTGLSGVVPIEVCDMVQSRKKDTENPLSFRASCPLAIECPCCTECCNKEKESDFDYKCKATDPPDPFGF